MSTPPDPDWGERFMVLSESADAERGTKELTNERFASPSDLTWTVVKNMLFIRKQRGLSALELATRMTNAGYPISRAVIANLENSRRRDLTVDHLMGLSLVFECPVEWLLGMGGHFCERCKGEPPAGYGCLSCGTQG